ncbi:hypothetical protein IE4803_CH02887 [Rhizobium etli bv. phaseoli str. IE4803]|uniref:Uncharacterized protein n=1 Tax=Rhizobium etli bv. mimosae str. IE4771 TaxID=1432050 RepID=A0A060HYI2_RHIET|nr:hypothetical protein IE4771_CH02918 [Rhizobium sp. IE4771]AJC80073.1 hypothetical protein IE4803_CH02887 [Rhizobium etli bv. phaseoli str. IE4803]ARQ59001.1 hypothetical protein Kim5_CH02960 [Rhizobium sp. Kim5]
MGCVAHGLSLQFAWDRLDGQPRPDVNPCLERSPRPGTLTLRGRGAMARTCSGDPFRRGD